MTPPAPNTAFRGPVAARNARGAERTTAEPGSRPGRYHIETWGCQMNVLDSDKLAGSLEHHGYLPAAGPENADVIILNTCSIREKAAEKIFTELGRLKLLKHRRPDVLLGVCGCVAQQEGRKIYERAPYVDFVLGPRATGTLGEILLRHRAGDLGTRKIVDVEYRSDSIDFPFDRIRRDAGAAGKAYVTIVEGCNHRCTFCIVPRTRGREICRELEVVLQEVRDLVTRGTLEVEFLGQTVNAYRDPAGNDLAQLLARASRVEGLARIRFTTSHPSQMTERLMDAMADAAPVVCPYLHLPVQSGSDRVLRAMRRGYDRGGYLRKIAGLRRRIPGISFGTDVIVGFPGETDEDFEATLSLIESVGFDTVYSFAYSPRPGTRAAELADLPLERKLVRLHRLQSLQRGIQQRRNAAWLGRSVEVLVEGRDKRDGTKWTGRTPEYRVVNFTGPAALGGLARVRITGSTAFSLQGEAAGG